MIIVKNGVVHDGIGGVYESDIVVKDGKFHKIEKNAELVEQENGEVFDANGCVIMPGFIDSMNSWGTVGPGWTEGDNHEGSDPITPEMNIIYGFDHDGMNFQKVYNYGVTCACIAPSSKNIISGQAAVFKTLGRSPYKMLVREFAAVVASVTNNVKSAYKKREVAPMTRMGIFSMLVGAIEKAARYNPEKDDYDAKSCVLKKVIEGEIPLFVSCSGKSQIEAVLSALAPYKNIKLTLAGAYGLDSALCETAKRDFSVLLGDQTEAYFPYNSKTEPEEIIKIIESGKLAAITCCGEGSTSGKESLLWNALYWRRRGLSADSALAAVTSVPAKILGIDSRVGSIEVGKDADFSIWTANPFDTFEAKPVKVFIDGEDTAKKEGGVTCW